MIFLSPHLKNRFFDYLFPCELIAVKQTCRLFDHRIDREKILRNTMNMVKTIQTFPPGYKSLTSKEEILSLVRTHDMYEKYLCKVKKQCPQTITAQFHQAEILYYLHAKGQDQRAYDMFRLVATSDYATKEQQSTSFYFLSLLVYNKRVENVIEVASEYMRFALEINSLPPYLLQTAVFYRGIMMFFLSLKYRDICFYNNALYNLKKVHEIAPKESEECIASNVYFDLINEYNTKKLFELNIVFRKYTNLNNKTKVVANYEVPLVIKE